MIIMNNIKMLRLRTKQNLKKKETTGITNILTK